MVSSGRVSVLFAATLLALVSAHGEDAKLFFGEIPIQYVGPGEKIVLDLHRFLHPPDASVHVDGPDASFDPKAFTVTVKAKAAGLSTWRITAELPTVGAGTSIRSPSILASITVSPDYYGDEIGMTGAGDPDNRRDMRFGDQVTENEKGVLKNFQKLTALRRAHPALRYGSRRTLLRETDCLAFIRAYFEDRVLVILNRSKSAHDISLDPRPEISESNLKNLMTNEQIDLTDKKLSMTIPASAALFIGQR